MKFAIFAIMMIGCIFAIIEITRAIMQYILFSKEHTDDIITVVPVTGKINDIEFIVRNLVWRSNWNSEDSTAKIILLDLGADEDAVNICRKLSEKNYFIEFLSPQEFENFLEEL